jgi:hypothetical protein
MGKPQPRRTMPIERNLEAWLWIVSVLAGAPRCGRVTNRSSVTASDTTVITLGYNREITRERKRTNGTYDW